LWVFTGELLNALSVSIFHMKDMSMKKDKANPATGCAGP
jgi:hypothetical protein